MERSSSACSAASSGERFACVSGGAASANGPKAESNVSTQRKGIKRLRIDLFKGCLTRNYTGPRNTQCTPPHSGAQSAARWGVAVRTTLLRRPHSAERCTGAKTQGPGGSNCRGLRQAQFRGATAVISRRCSVGTPSAAPARWYPLHASARWAVLPLQPQVRFQLSTRCQGADQPPAHLTALRRYPCSWPPAGRALPGSAAGGPNYLRCARWSSARP